MTSKYRFCRIALGCFVLIGSALAQAPKDDAPKDTLFAGTESFAKGASDVTDIELGPRALSMLKKNQEADSSLRLNVVRVYRFDKPGMYRPEDIEPFRKRIQGPEWDCSVRIRDPKTGDATDICDRRRNDGLKETAIIIVQKDSLTFIHKVRKPPR